MKSFGHILTDLYCFDRHFSGWLSTLPLMIRFYLLRFFEWTCRVFSLSDTTLTGLIFG